MEFTTFVRKPFTVDAVQITRDNIEELAPLVGELKQKENGDPYILVDRKKVPNVLKVYPGYWLTKMDQNIRCYSRKVFGEQFTPTTSEIEDWLVYLNSL